MNLFNTSRMVGKLLINIVELVLGKRRYMSERIKMQRGLD
jgi:hypothetical protein